MTRVITEDVGSFSQHYPKFAVVVTAQARGKEDAMAAAWHTSISFKPPIYGVAISPKRFTYQLIAESKEFGVNFIPFDTAGLIASVGGSRGDEIDKFQKFDIAKTKPAKTSVPILDGAYAAYECKLIDDVAYGDHHWLVGEILAVHVVKESFNPEGILNLNKVKPALYLGRDLYVTTAKRTVKSLDRKVYGKH